MQEFSSVTASSYDADSLAPMLTEKSAEGWSVVAIVSAGTNIVAYLERESDGTTPSAATTETTTEAPAEEANGVATPVVSTESAPVDEPSGWAAAPAESSTETYGAQDTAAAQDAAAPEPAASAEIASLAAEVGASDDSTAQAAAPEATAAPAVESTVPAGWYADPSGRFELRYWDGNAWTEHVSRAGQQFTDPPVA